MSLLPMPQFSEHYGKTRTEINKYMNLFLRNTPTARPGRSCTYVLTKYKNRMQWFSSRYV